MSALRINLPGQPVRHLAPDGTAYVPSQGHSFRGAVVRPMPAITEALREKWRLDSERQRAKARAQREPTA
uniref:Uncharacterized protein n=1 Tax=viral metagenome TaxID=1070528 RepID=A0A6M3L3X9_9ZZZZ